jgi:hypothetical protein
MGEKMNLIESCKKDFNSFQKNRLNIIFIMFFIYSLVFYIDICFTLDNLELEGNPISKFFISLVGFPLNLFIPYIIIFITFCFNKTLNLIKSNKRLFWIYYVSLIVFIISHIGGIISWL